MVRRVDRMKDIQGRAFGKRGAPYLPHAIFGPVQVRDGRGLVATQQAEPPRMSLARKLERDPRLAGRAANWLFIKGGIILLLGLGLFVLGLVGIFR